MEIKEVLGKNGLIANRIKNYEIRKQQIDLSEKIDNCFSVNKFLIAEAPCGVGKTFSYLVPAILKKQKIVIATANITLQEQLVKKDLPFLQEILEEKDIKFKFSLVKGRGNYLCHDKVEAYDEDKTRLDSKEDTVIAETIRDWFKYTDTGDKSELEFDPPRNVWELFSITENDCKGKKCKFLPQCFFNKKKTEYFEADILVCNYNILILDAIIKNLTDGKKTLLGHFDYLVCDEAHNIEGIARDSFSEEFKQSSIKKIIGAIGSLKDHLKGDYYNNAEKKDCEEICKNLEIKSNNFFSSIKNYRDKFKDTDYLRTKEKNIVPYQDLYNELLSSSNFFKKAAISLERAGSDQTEIYAKFHNTSMELAEILRKNIEQKDDNYAYWISKVTTKKGDYYSLVNKPVYIGPYLKNLIWDQIESGIFLSATLAFGKGNFSFMKNAIGLNGLDIEEFMCDSPFDFKSQCGLIVPKGIEVPTPENDKDFKLNFLEKTQDAIELSKGRAMVLFTSYSHLNYFYENCHRIKKKYKVISQGSGELNRTRMIEEFKEDNSSVLLGTSSFWEGVDVQGDALSLLIIDKLPFPNIKQDPVLDSMQEKNKSFFMEEYLPRAIIMLKQGFGRLIRSKEDKGCVVIFDKRIMPNVKNYSRTFLQSLPEGIPFSDNIEDLKKFFT
jgi:ATP-dependent DNA helicase DinG